MRTITLIGGPRDGRTITVDGDVTTINTPAMSDWYDGRRRSPQHDIWFTMHTYDALTGIWRTGRTKPNLPAIPARFTLFGPRVERLLARLDRP